MRASTCHSLYLNEDTTRDHTPHALSLGPTNFATAIGRLDDGRQVSMRIIRLFDSYLLSLSPVQISCCLVYDMSEGKILGTPNL